ncbi:MAG: RagB/SusD family nutrient uptake outer membrane protein [Bacteroidales bacterium]|nr:RagB/SusD family nutrient uptake outer membrane protein [Bacteroidales bacterium]
MKKIFNFVFVLAALTLVSCNKDFLERPSKTTMNDENFWSSEGNIRLFVNGAYTNYFPGYYYGWSYNYAPGVRGDGAAGEWSDDICTSGTQQQPLNAATDIASSFNDESNTFYSKTQSCGWNFAWVRKWNLLLARLDTMKEAGKLSDEAYNHWTGVARFLRGFEYSRLVMSFGDVPYYDKVVDAEDFESQYAPRTSRVEVMKHVMDDFKYAMANVRLDDGANFINKGVVGTFGSRFMLFEGTWEVYHKTAGGDPKAFLQTAMDLAGAVMESGKYQFNCSFKDLFGSETQVGNETILFRSYSAAVSVRHCITTYSMPQYGQGGYANHNHFESWICTDGKPFTTSTVANAESWKVQDMRITRDPRFESTFYDEPNSINGGGLFAWKWIDRKGPETYYEKTYGSGAAIPTQYGSAYNTTGAPVVRYAETVLNWIEAKAELADKFGGAAVSQADLDKSINAIRKRPLDATATALGCQQTAPLTLALAETNAAADPQYNDAVYKVTLASKNGFKTSPIIWEIRRERRMEFFNEHFRSADIRRWGELERLNNETNPKTTYGVYLDASELGEDLLAYRVDGKVNMKDPRYFGAYKKQYTITAKLAGQFQTMGLDGVKHVYSAKADEATGAITESNLKDMSGFRIPENFTARKTVSERDYLYPVPSSVINEYANKNEADPSFPLMDQNPGW